MIITPERSDCESDSNWCEGSFSFSHMLE